MRNIFGNKIVVILAASAAILALVVLASGIGRMQFREATPYNWGLPSRTVSGEVSDQPLGENLALFNIIMFWALLVTLVVIISLLVSPKIRKIFLKRLFQGIAFALSVYYLLKLDLFKEILPGEEAAIAPPSRTGLEDNLTSVLPPQFVPPDSSSPWSYIITLVILLGIFLMGWWYYRLSRRPVSTVHLDIAEIARETVQDIQKGMDWGDTITRCYLRMAEAVNTSRGIMRPIGMTPAEFAVHLKNAGLPSEPVNRLTGLFERVRYGGRQAPIEEQQEAIMCLNSIIRACGGEIR